MNNKETKEFISIAKDLYEGSYSPFSFTRKDMYGNKRKYSYNGEIFYSTIWQRVKQYTTQAKRSRAYDFIHDYLQEHNIRVHS